ncbi:cyclic peptide export ABC transporter [Reichenbachiella sp. MALMAid0571]|uniref:cyclic peptide export ABC transporter n=1 Tax=Reichenbachiella sp. MALMAid0571 TaxID=3143939 RepID=UPI0032DF8640
MKTILFFIRKSITKFLLASLLSVTGGLCGTFAIKQLNDAVHAGLSDPNKFILYFGLSIFGFIVLSVISTKLLAVIIQNSIFELRKEFALKLTQASYQKIENKKKEILNVLTHDITTISNLIDKVPNLIVSLSLALGILGYLFYLSPKLSLLVAGVFLSSFIILMLTNKKLRYYAHMHRQAWDKCFVKINDMVFGLRELNLNSEHKSFFVEKELPDALKEELYFKIKERVNIQVSDKLAESLMLSGLAVIIVIIYYNQMVSFEFFSEFIMMSIFMLSPMASVAGFMKNLRPLEAALNHIDKLGISLNLYKEESVSLENTIVADKGFLSLRGVSYEHTSKDSDFSFTLGPIDLDINRNEILFITGGNGSGKTTLSKIITGLYVPKSGQIWLNGNFIERENLMLLRNKFSSIYSDNYVFENINYIDFEEGEVIRLLHDYKLSGRVRLDKGIYSEIHLSSGQLKRLAMVTAILEDKEIYLFDEWAANQDPTFKELFYQKLLPDMKKAGKTIIVITHDEQYYDSADRVIKIVEGKYFTDVL